MLTGFVVFLLCVVAWTGLRLWLTRDATLLRRDEAGLLRIELWRRTGMHSHADGRGGQSYPEPRETRSLNWLICGLPVWSRDESIGLPAHCEGRIDSVAADEFDRHFNPAFRIRHAPHKPHWPAAA